MTAMERLDMHERLLELYRLAGRYADLLDAAGNVVGAELVRERAAAVARSGDLEKIRKGEVCAT